MVNRRTWLRTATAWVAAVGARSMATGVPAHWLLHGIPSDASAAEAPPQQFLVLATSASGPPLNVHCPGSYVPGVEHNVAFQTPVRLSLGGHATFAAAPYRALPQWALDRSTFIHHATYTPVHTEHANVLRLNGQVVGADGRGTDALYAAFGRATAQSLGTLQQAPVAVGAAGIEFNGRPVPSINPRALANLFAPEEGTMLKVAELRTQALDDLYNKLRADGTRAQRRALDSVASSAAQVNKLDASLVSLLNDLPEDPTRATLLGALVLIRMGVAPVITVDLPLGGDNHTDPDDLERTELAATMGALGFFFQRVQDFGLQDRVTFASMNVFGRTLKRVRNGAGRNHNPNHHVTTITGPNVAPGVIGGLRPDGPNTRNKDLSSTGINSVTGGSERPDIPPDSSLESAGKTLGRALGLQEPQVNAMVRRGKVISAALR